MDYEKTMTPDPKGSQEVRSGKHATCWKEIDRLRAEVEKYRGALNEIASWDEGPTVNASFDDPESAEIARAALAPTEEKA